MDIEVNAAFSDLLEFAGVDGARIALNEMSAQGPQLLTQIDAGVAAGDADAVAEAAHSLKSSCGALSLSNSSALAAQLEVSAQSGGAEDLVGLAETLKSTFEIELAAIRAYVDRKAGDGASE